MMQFVRTYSVYACLLQARSGSEKFWLNVYYCKYKSGRRLDAEKAVNKPFENVSYGRCNQKIFKGHQISTFFQAYFFFGRINLKQVEKRKKAIEGPGACSSGKFLKIHVL